MYRPQEAELGGRMGVGGAVVEVRKRPVVAQAGAYTRPLLSST